MTRNRPGDAPDTRLLAPNLQRALALMELLARSPGGMGLSDLASGLELPRNSVLRIVRTLHEAGYVGRDEDSRRYSLTRKLLALGYAAAGGQDLVEKSLDVLRDLRDATRETALLGVLADDEGLVLEQAPGLHPFKFLVDAGMRFPLHVAAPGKALMAFLPQAEQDAVVRRLVLKRFNANTITTRRALREELGRVRTQGFAVDRAEQLEGVHCIAAPVLDQRDRPIASIWITGPADRLPEGRFGSVGQLVMKHAARISRRFGHGLI